MILVIGLMCRCSTLGLRMWASRIFNIQNGTVEIGIKNVQPSHIISYMQLHRKSCP